MAVSISRVPSAGTVLETRVKAWEQVANDSQVRELVPPELRMKVEDELLRRDPRLWKHPVDMIVRAHVIPNVYMRFGEEAARDLMKHPDLARAIAADAQELAKATATAAEKAREPKTNTPWTVAIIVIMEFLLVGKLHPQASFDRQCEITGANLGGPGYAIDRVTIRRIVLRNYPLLFPRSDHAAALALKALEELEEILGWRPARKAG